LFATNTDEDLQQRVVQAHQIGGGRDVLPSAERGLGAERLPQWLISDDLQERIMAQAVGVIGVFVTGDDLVDTLSEANDLLVSPGLHAPGTEMGQSDPATTSRHLPQ
jgi:hypothetical protein